MSKLSTATAARSPYKRCGHGRLVTARRRFLSQSVAVRGVMHRGDEGGRTPRPDCEPTTTARRRDPFIPRVAVATGMVGLSFPFLTDPACVDAGGGSGDPAGSVRDQRGAA